MLLIITGKGKGKTTSALGSAVRAAGWNKKVAIIFFDKGGSHYGEQEILETLKDKIDTFRFGLPRFDEAKKDFRFDCTEEDRVEAIAALRQINALYKNDYFLIVCDEIINCLNLNMISRGDADALINNCPEKTHLVFTGRDAPEWLINKADLVSEIAEVKHYFSSGKDAIKGLDY